MSTREPEPEAPATIPASQIPPPPADTDSRIGTTLGKYRIGERLGIGGMGMVYAAEDLVLHRPVALKLLPPDVALNPERSHRMLRKARAAARLNHPNVVTIYEANYLDGTFFIAMELVEGGSLESALKAQGAFYWQRATRYAADACRGLAVAHAAGLIHRDLKPANLLRTRDDQIKVADFGLARDDAGSLAGTITGGPIGTPLFMSPEQCRGEPVDARADVYSLGATYFALLTGEPPFPGKGPMEQMFAHCSLPVPDPRQIDPAIPDACAALVQRAMAKDPAERPASAEAMLGELEALLAPTEPSLPVSPKRSRFPFTWLLLAAATVLVNGGIALVLWQPWSGPPAKRTNPVVSSDAEQGRAVAALQKFGAKITFDEQTPGRPVTEVELASDLVTDADLVHLRSFTHLNWLNLSCPHVGDAGLAHVAGHAKLTHVFLDRMPVTDAGLAHLKGMENLLTVQLSYTQVRGPGLAHLKESPLVSLDLNGTEFDDAGMALVPSWPRFEILRLHNTKVSDDGLEHLKDLQRLTHLMLSQTKVTGRGLSHLAGLTALKDLNLANTKIDDAGLAHLRKLDKLEELSLDNTAVGDKGLEHLRGLKGLRRLSIRNTKVRDTKDLEHALPQLHIER